MPVPVAVPRLLRVCCGGEWVDGRLVGVVPVAAGQPERGTVADGDLDVVSGGEDPRGRLLVQPGQRPCLGKFAAEGLEEPRDRGRIALVRGRVPRGMI